MYENQLNMKGDHGGRQSLGAKGIVTDLSPKGVYRDSSFCIRAAPKTTPSSVTHSFASKGSRKRSCSLCGCPFCTSIPTPAALTQGTKLSFPYVSSTAKTSCQEPFVSRLKKQYSGLKVDHLNSKSM